MNAQANVVGNNYDKYGTKNPIARWLMKGFLDGVSELYAKAQPNTVLEVGCGEGRLAAHLCSVHRPKRFLATDISLDRIDPQLDPVIETQQASAYELPFEDNSFDTVVCCEVLEHLEEPARGLAELSRVARQHVLISTPWEPVWRAMNMARAKYLLDLGNTPGHIQHFSRAQLRALASTQLRLLEMRTPVPWTILLGAPLG